MKIYTLCGRQEFNKKYAISVHITYEGTVSKVSKLYNSWYEIVEYIAEE